MLTLILFCFKDNYQPFACGISFPFFLLLQKIFCMLLEFLLVFCSILFMHFSFVYLFCLPDGNYYCKTSQISFHSYRTFILVPSERPSSPICTINFPCTYIFSLDKEFVSSFKLYVKFFVLFHSFSFEE